MKEEGAKSEGRKRETIRLQERDERCQQTRGIGERQNEERGMQAVAGGRWADIAKMLKRPLALPAYTLSHKTLGPSLLWLLLPVVARVLFDDLRKKEKNLFSFKRQDE